MKTHLMKLFAVALLAAGCKTESISEVATSEVTAGISAIADGNGSTDVNATFRKGALSLTFLQLTADDKVEVTQGTTTKRMTEASLLGVVTYGASMPVDADGTAFTVSLKRIKDSGAPMSVATLPQGFTITALVGSFSRATPGPTIVWSNATGEPMNLKLTGECIDELSVSAPASSMMYTVAANALHKRSATTADGGTVQVPDSCTVTAELTRTKPGTLDPAYANGSAQGIQRRTVTFTTAP